MTAEQGAPSVEELLSTARTFRAQIAALEIPRAAPGSMVGLWLATAEVLEAVLAIDRAALVAEVRAEVASYDAYPKGSTTEPLFTEASDMPESIAARVLALIASTAGSTR